MLWREEVINHRSHQTIEINSQKIQLNEEKLESNMQTQRKPLEKTSSWFGLSAFFFFPFLVLSRLFNGCWPVNKNRQYHSFISKVEDWDSSVLTIPIYFGSGELIEWKHQSAF